MRFRGERTEDQAKVDMKFFSEEVKEQKKKKIRRK